MLAYSTHTALSVMQSLLQCDLKHADKPPGIPLPHRLFPRERHIPIAPHTTHVICVFCIPEAIAGPNLPAARQSQQADVFPPSLRKPPTSFRAKRGISLLRSETIH